MAKNAAAAKAQQGGNAQNPSASGADQVVNDVSTSTSSPAADSGAHQGNAAPGAGNSSTTAGQASTAIPPTADQVSDSGSVPSAGMSAPVGPTESSSSDTGEAAGTGASSGNGIASMFPSTRGLKVTSRQAGFRRAGRAWSTTPTVIALSELTEGEVKALATEPMLTVQPVWLDDAGEEF